MKEKNAALETENSQLRQRCARMTEESNMEKFKCQLLVEMVRLSIGPIQSVSRVIC